LPEGVEVVCGDLSSPQSLAAAVGDVDSVYLMWPGIPLQPRVVEVLATRAKRVVCLSTDVVDLADGEQATSYHQEIERLRCGGRICRQKKARKQLTATWGNAQFVEARLKAWASFVESPERVTDTVERLLGRPARTFRSWARDHADDFR
jgi:hypothetical protein